MSTAGTNSLDGEKVEIKLERGKTGLGFNIKGGSDMQLLPGDNGIYIAKIKDDGAAASDGRLKVGDKIVSVNGISLVGVKHDFAVQTFVKAGPVVNIEVVSGAEQTARKRLRQNENNSASPSSKALAGILVGVGIIAVIGFGVYRYTRRGGFS